MFNILFQIWFLVVIMPMTIAQEGWGMFKEYMSHGKRWYYFPYYLLAFFVLLLIILLLAGYR
jgi:hypothetical protein